MALLQKIKAKLGFGSNSTDHDGGETTVTVEKDADGEDDSSTVDDGTTAETAESADHAESADAVGVDTEPEPVDDGESGETDDVDTTDAEPADDTPANAADPDDDADATDADATDAKAADADATDTDEPAVESDGDPVEGIKGIGPAYSERLSEMGIHSVADLAAADPADVAEGAKVGEKRAATWIQRAEEF
ncbi:helix-hairpin-helix domain-containing protein [Halorubrum tibetense]|uniref:Helix-hairpin-helix domain-containing protein n=1 Tax=Halorubrum tibetense TaxID=175631 RepID=A0ABD5SIW4_9EURY